MILTAWVGRQGKGDWGRDWGMGDKEWGGGGYIPAEEKKVTGRGEDNEYCQVILLASLACQPALGFHFYRKIIIFLTRKWQKE